MQIKGFSSTLLTITVMVILASYAFNEPAMNDDDPNPWLGQFLDEEVVCVFIEPLPTLGPAIKAELKDYCEAGLVLEWNEKEGFYPYSNIVWIKPAKKVKWGVLTKELRSR